MARDRRAALSGDDKRVDERKLGSKRPNPTVEAMIEGVRVYIVDDDVAVRESLTDLLSLSGCHVISFSTAVSFLEIAHDLPIGCLLSDVQMPGMSGLELLCELERQKLDFPVIVMTAFSDIPTAVEAIRLGALDFIEKPLSNDKLLQALTHAREKIKKSQNEIDDTRAARECVARLTPRERDVCRRLVAGLPNKGIANDLGLSVRTIEAYRARVMRKMRARSLSELVRLALAAGMELTLGRTKHH